MFRTCEAGLVLYSIALAGAKATTIDVPSDYIDIQSAVDVADSGDSIRVAIGTHLAPVEVTSGTLTIIGVAGAEQTTVEGDAAHPVFTVEDGASLNLEGLRIIGGFHAHMGGGVRVEDGGSAWISECTIENNNTDASGGGVGVGGGALAQLVDSRVENNSAGRRGGGIAALRGGDVVIDRTDISNNHASEDGGGIHLESGGALTAFGGRITDNTADRHGGAIRLMDAGTASFDSTEINRNVAPQRGGAIFANNSGVELIDVTMTGNGAEKGGGLYQTGLASLTATGCRFDANTATEHGGAFYLYASEGATINDCTFIGNSSGDRGGGIAAIDGGSLSFDSTEFDGNMSSQDGDTGAGGGVFAAGDTDVQVLACTFTRNYSKNGAGLKATGGVVLVVAESEFTENVAGNPEVKGFGGGINYYDDSSGRIVDSVFERNSATTEGGGIHIHLSDVEMERLTVCDNTAIGRNPEEGWGGGIFLFESFSHVLDCTICNNITTRGGGGLYSQGPESAVRGESGSSIVDCLVYGNTAGAGGGIQGSIADSLVIMNCEIRDNEADRQGGIGIVGGSAAIVTGNIITGNRATGTATENGGGGLFSGDGPVLVASNYFALNDAPGTKGGAIRINGAGQAAILGNVLRQNSSELGGGISLAGGCLVEIERNLFDGNRSTGEAAALSASAPVSGLISRNTIVHSEVGPGADGGAAVYFLGAVQAWLQANIIAFTDSGAALRMSNSNPVPIGRNLMWANAEGPYIGLAAAPYDMLVDPRFVEQDTTYVPSDRSAAIDGGTGRLLPQPQGPRPDVGWKEHGYPAEPRLMVEVESIPDTVMQGAVVDAIVRVRNLSNEEQTVDVVGQVAGLGGIIVSIAEQETFSPDEEKTFYEIRQLPPYIYDAGFTIHGRVFVNEELEASASRDLWISSAP